jgi:hypothetical protein
MAPPGMQIDWLRREFSSTFVEYLAAIIPEIGMFVDLSLPDHGGWMAGNTAVLLLLLGLSTNAAYG